MMKQGNNKLFEVIKSRKVFDFDFYRKSYHIHNKSDDELIHHYIEFGDKNNYQPNAIFSPIYYRANRVVKKELFENSLVDYLLVGSRYGVAPCIGVDVNHIADMYGVSIRDTVKLYVEKRQKGEYINPNKYFDCEYYLNTYPDIKSAGLDPFYHFINWGANEGRVPLSGFSWGQLVASLGEFQTNQDAYQALISLPESLKKIIQKKKSSAKLLNEIKAIHKTDRYERLNFIPPDAEKIPVEVFAFYLTQFHQIPENDEWWGPGFTEWNNVVRGLPRFEGHYQPRIPADLGFYDLSDVKILRKQVEFAKAGGVAGFGFYYYNFGGKRLLEKPLNLFLGDKSLDLKFFYIWANETWSRRWDGSENEVLIEQRYPDLIIDEIVGDACAAFEDPRYHRISGTPLFVIYRPSGIPDAKKFIKNLRAAFESKGQFPLIYMAQSFNDVDPEVYDLDGAMEFPPHKYTTTTPTINPATLYTDSVSLRVHHYDEMVKFAKNVKGSEFPLIRSCFPSWDNDARKQGASVVIHGSTPEKFATWLELTIRETQSRPNHPQMVCVNAWNEWGEGAYLEPDRHFGFSYLNALQGVVFNQHRGKRNKVLLIGHDAFASGAQRLLLHIGESLKKNFAADITFFILRSDDGYDEFLKNYKKVARTLVANFDDVESVKTQLSFIGLEGYSHAIVNTAASSWALPLLNGSWKSVQLIHELGSMLKKIDADGCLQDNLSYAANIVAPSVGVSKILEGVYKVPKDKLIERPQGLYRNIKTVDRSANGKFWCSIFGVDVLPKIVVGLGYADRRKGIDIFLQVCKSIADTDLDVRFVWQGDWDSSLRTELDSEINDLINSGKLHLEPSKEIIEPLLDIADVFFLSSREDPLPTVAFEAWAFGKPVVAFRNTGGIADLIQFNGFLGALADSPSVHAATAVIVNTLQADNDGVRQQRIDWVNLNCQWNSYVYDLQSYLFNAPTIDVFIVAHNHADFAEKRVSSLINQSMPARSISYIDVGSSETTKNSVSEQLARFSSRVETHFVQSNHGKLYQTWLDLAKSSTAEYIHIAEGDDFVVPEFLEKLVGPLSMHEGAAFAFSAVKWVDESGTVVNDDLLGYVSNTLGIDGYGGGFVDSKTALNSGLLVANPILSMSSVVWRRNFLVKAIETRLQDFSSMSFAYDWVLYFVSCLNSDGFVFVPEVLTHHTQHSKSMSAGSSEKHKMEILKCHNFFKSSIGVSENKIFQQDQYINNLS